MQEMQNVLKDKEVKLPIEDKKAVPGLRSVDISDIPQDFINATKDNLDNQMGGLGGLGSDIGMGGEEPMPDEGMGGDLGGAGLGGETSEPGLGTSGGAGGGINLTPQ